MKQLKTILLLGTWLLLLAACGEGAEEAVVDQATEVAGATETTPPPRQRLCCPRETVPPTETALPPTETPAPTATAEMVASTCVTCHSDQAMLVDTAAPAEDEPEETESSGVG